MLLFFKIFLGVLPWLTAAHWSKLERKRKQRKWLIWRVWWSSDCLLPSAPSSHSALWTSLRLTSHLFLSTAFVLCSALLSPAVLFQQVALEKVFNFATTNIFETRVSGRMVADMCRAAAKVSLVTGEQAFGTFCSFLFVCFFNLLSIHSVILQSPSKCLCHTVVMP